MTTATKVYDYTVKPQAPMSYGTDDIHDAIAHAFEAWQATECDVEILDNRDGNPRVIAIVKVEWTDGE